MFNNLYKKVVRKLYPADLCGVSEKEASALTLQINMLISGNNSLINQIDKLKKEKKFCLKERVDLENQNYALKRQVAKLIAKYKRQSGIAFGYFFSLIVIYVIGYITIR